MSTTIQFEPLLPSVWIIALAAAAVLFALPGLFRRLRAAWLRAAALALVVLALFNPVAVNEEREPLSTVVAVVSDQSSSQNLGERRAQTETIRDHLASVMAGFDDIELRFVEARDTSGGGDGTRLFEPLTNALADVPPERIGAMILATDGQVHDIPEEVSGLPGNAPLHVLLTGERGERDRRIVIESAPRFGIVNERQEIAYRVIDDGVDSRQSVEVIVTVDGEPHSVAIVTAGEVATARIEITHGGQNIIELRAVPLDGELTELNNRAIVPIEGIRENLRVLLVSGEPHSGERTWRNLLKSDASVDLVHFTILRPPSKQDGTPINQLSLIAFPTRELFSEKIDEFDLIIFDRYHHRGVLPMLYFDNIARYVRDGGALMIAAGPDFAGFSSLYHTPLSPVLPVVPTGKILEEPFHARVTEIGGRHPVTRSLEGAEQDPPEWGRFFRLIEVAQPSGATLMDGMGDNPLLVLQREGEGRVAMLLTDHTWLWARGFEGGGPHVDLLRRLAHWLMKEPDLEEEAMRATVIGPDLVIERQTMLESAEPMTVFTPSGGTLERIPDEVEPGRWRASVPAEEIGLYRVEQDIQRTFVHVGPPNPREFIDARSTDEHLASLVTTTGGRIDWAESRGAQNLPRVVPVRRGATLAGSDWIGVRMTEASVLKGVNRIPLLGGFGGFFGIAGLLGLLVLLGVPFATWLREGR